MLLIFSLIGQLSDPMPAFGLTMVPGQELALSLPREEPAIWTVHDLDRSVLTCRNLSDQRTTSQLHVFVAVRPGKTKFRLIYGRGSEPSVRIVEVTVEVTETKEQR